MRPKLSIVLLALMGFLPMLSAQTFVIENFSRSPAEVLSGENVSVAVRVRNTGTVSGPLRSVRVVAAPVPAPLTAVPSEVVYNPARIIAAGQSFTVPLNVAMPVLNNCTTIWSFGFDAAVDAGSGIINRSFTSVGHNVTVLPNCADLTAPMPPGWDRQVLFSNTLNASTSSGLVSVTLPIYVSAYVTNLGGATPAGVPCRLRIRRSSDNLTVYSIDRILPPLAAGATDTSWRNTIIPAGVLTPCDNYDALLQIDPDNIVVESNNGNNQYTSVDIFLTAPQSIQSQPQSLTVCAGEPASFRIVVNSGGAEVYYRWKKNNVVIPLSGLGGNPSANTDTLIIANAQAADIGSYTCAASTACELLPSQAATLTVRASTQINEHPLPQATCPGQTIELSVSATGSAPVGYQWRKGGVLIIPAGNPSAVTPTLVLPNVQPEASGLYDCVVTGACGAVTSNSALLSVCQLAADVDCNGAVSLADLAVLLSNFGRSDNPPRSAGNLNGDGNVNLTDLAMLLIEFGQACP